MRNCETAGESATKSHGSAIEGHGSTPKARASTTKGHGSAPKPHIQKNAQCKPAERACKLCVPAFYRSYPCASLFARR